jgi:hypothetical protein
LSGASSLIDHIRAALQPHGLFLRGSLVFDDDGPLLPYGPRARAVVLVGNIGGSLWPAFARWKTEQGQDLPPEPLDQWSKAVILPVAEAAGATAFFPSDPPWQPFQQWAMRAEGLKASPLGILIHPHYGLWHGYRGALAFEHLPEGLEESSAAGPHPCTTCADKPCLSTCPASAILPEGFQYTPCRSFLGRPEGIVCLEGGCVARNSCPVGADYRYPEEQVRFHMAALKRL